MRRVYKFKMDSEFDNRFRSFQSQLNKDEKIVHTIVEGGIYIVTTEEAKSGSKKLLLDQLER